ncbi:MAG: sugar phosphate nucleotidyltransferase [Methermicoccaceae archaeon]
MIGMILCGGKGKRLPTIGEDIPKPLVEIKDGYSVRIKDYYRAR